MKDLYTLVKGNKRIKVLCAFGIFVLFITILNVSFSAFTQSTQTRAANIKVGNLSYTINGTETFSIKANKNDITRNNITLLNLDNLDTKYEITYDVYTDENLSNKVDKPNGLKVEYSSLSPDSVKGILNKTDSKSIRLIITNETDTDYYVKLGVNGGFAYNALEYKNNITNEYIEDDLYIAAYVENDNNEMILQTSFPTTNNYSPVVECTGESTSSKPHAALDWENNEWKLRVNNIKAGETRCNVYFKKGSPTGYWDTTAETNLKLLYVIKRDNDLVSPLTSPGKEINLENEAVLSPSEDDYGMSYYFRGNVQNNYVVFANKCWKIVRILGNGAIKLFYWGNVTNNKCGEADDAMKSQFNSKKWEGLTNPAVDRNNTIDVYTYNRPAGIGFMYGDVMGSSYASVHENVYDSTILEALKSFYDNNIIDNNLEDYMADVVWCNDKSLESGSDGAGYEFDKFTWFNARERIYAKGNYKIAASPSLICRSAGTDGKLSKYTAADTTNGNGKLKGINGVGAVEYKIGLLTIDEAAFSGGVQDADNSSIYLETNFDTWLISPNRYDSDMHVCRIGTIRATGSLSNAWANSNISFHPSIALLPSVTISSGDGTINNPYIVS